MGNGVGKLTVCFTGGNHVGHQKDMDLVMFDPIDDLGHSFCYVRPDPTRISSSKVHSEEETTTFRSISGASVSANTATPLSTSLIDLHSYNSIDRASVFESSTSFASISLQAQRRNSGPITADGGFMSGPLERGFQSGPLLSGPLDQVQFQRSYSHGGFAFRRRSRRGSVIGLIRKAVSKTISRGQNSVSVVAPVKGSDWEKNNHSNGGGGGYNYGNKKESAAVRSSHGSSLEDDESLESQDLQWAQGKAGEDRVHVVVSEEQGWVFVGIYDGFNGPDAPDFLVSNLYPAIDKELRELLRDDNLESSNSESPESKTTEDDHEPGRVAEDSEDKKRRRNKNDSIRARNGKKWKNQRRWKCEFDRERLELKQELNSKGGGGSGGGNHPGILKALYRGLKKTEEAYLDITDMMLVENPELALMGSCVLVMLMKGEDVYVMNVGDSRAVLARKAEPDIWRQDLERIKEETLYDLQVSCRDDDEDYDEDHDRNNPTTSLTALQLSMDHSTSIQEEVERIKSEHPDDPCAIVNDRVKGSLKVTRAFGAGFLKQPKWNNALLEMFRIDYVGNSPYLNCLPYLCHHRLGPRDRFLILSSDGLYQYFTNEEAVSEVELFFRWSPEGDPAQHLVEEVLLRAARKAGLDFHELLEIPQGDRRRYHDDISIIVISLQGRIWRSCV